MIRIINWILILTYPLRTLFKTKLSGKVTFESDSFDKYNEYLPWYKDSKANQDWNTYGIFSQKYGTFSFTAKLWQPIGKKSWPAIWLLNIKTGVYYLETDIELMCPKKRTGIYFTTYVWYSKFKITHDIAFREGLDAYCKYTENEVVFNPYTRNSNHIAYINWEYGFTFNFIQKRDTIKFQVKTKNRSLIRELQTQENTYTIQWSDKYVKWYINGVLIAYTTNAPRDEMFIVISKIDKCKVKVLE